MTSSISPGDETQAPSAAAGSGKQRLSTVSKMYDIRGDGELDEAELAMRHMDTSGRGYLTNEKVYQLMQDHVQTQRKLF